MPNRKYNFKDKTWTYPTEYEYKLKQAVNIPVEYWTMEEYEQWEKDTFGDK